MVTTRPSPSRLLMTSGLLGYGHAYSLWSSMSVAPSRDWRIVESTKRTSAGGRSGAQAPAIASCPLRRRAPSPSSLRIPIQAPLPSNRRRREITDCAVRYWLRSPISVSTLVHERVDRLDEISNGAYGTKALDGDLATGLAAQAIHEVDRVNAVDLQVLGEPGVQGDAGRVELEELGERCAQLVENLVGVVH